VAGAFGNIFLVVHEFLDLPAGKGGFQQLAGVQVFHCRRSPGLVVELPGRIALQQDASSGTGELHHRGELPLPIRGADKLDEDADHPVEGFVQIGRWPILCEHVGQAELDRDATTSCQSPGLFDRDRGDFNRGDVQALLCQPD
jgi:hypothetical protein